MNKIWNKDAIDYSYGVDIVDLITNTIYTDEQARKLSKEIQSRLILRGRVVGCLVNDI